MQAKHKKERDELNQKRDDELLSPGQYRREAFELHQQQVKERESFRPERPEPDMRPRRERPEPDMRPRPERPEPIRNEPYNPIRNRIENMSPIKSMGPDVRMRDMQPKNDGGNDIAKLLAEMRIQTELLRRIADKEGLS